MKEGIQTKHKFKYLLLKNVKRFAILTLNREKIKKY